MEDLNDLLNENIFAINTVWVALCAALIFFMEAGFALLEAGFIRAKNAMSIIAKVIIDITFGGIAFFTLGFGIAYGISNGWIAFDFGITERDLGLGLTVSNQLFWFIQLGFAIAAISIVSGALAERMKLWSYAFLVVDNYILITILFVLLILSITWVSLNWRESSYRIFARLILCQCFTKAHQETILQELMIRIIQNIKQQI